MKRKSKLIISLLLALFVVAIVLSFVVIRFVEIDMPGLSKSCNGNVAFEEIDKRLAYTGQQYEKRFYEVSDLSEFEKIWGELYLNTEPVPNLPEIDFDKEMILVVHQGRMPSGGFSIQITCIEEKEISVEVFVEEITPGKFSSVTMAVTSPYHIVKIKKTDKEIVFVTD